MTINLSTRMRSTRIMKLSGEVTVPFDVVSRLDLDWFSRIQKRVNRGAI